MAWRRPGAKPLSEPMMVSLLTHLCVTRPQRVNLFLTHSSECAQFQCSIQTLREKKLQLFCERHFEIPFLEWQLLHCEISCWPSYQHVGIVSDNDLASKMWQAKISTNHGLFRAYMRHSVSISLYPGASSTANKCLPDDAYLLMFVMLRTL